MEHILGYFACGINLISMTMKDITRLRYLSLTANAIFAFYGLQLGSPPVIASSTIAAMIHTYQLVRLHQSTQRQ